MYKNKKATHALTYFEVERLRLIKAYLKQF